MCAGAPLAQVHVALDRDRALDRVLQHVGVGRVDAAAPRPRQSHTTAPASSSFTTRVTAPQAGLTYSRTNSATPPSTSAALPPSDSAKPAREVAAPHHGAARVDPRGDRQRDAGAAAARRDVGADHDHAAVGGGDQRREHAVAVAEVLAVVRVQLDAGGGA
jgi:hypothetical protein